MERLLELAGSTTILQSWNPRKKMVKAKKQEVIRTILSSRHIHKFKCHQLVFTNSKSSVWNDIVDELYGKDPATAAYYDELVKYFAVASKPPRDGRLTFFSTFVDRLIQLHLEMCTECTL